MVTGIASKRILVDGGGFAGLGCARALARHSGLRITLIDKNNYHQFQPMLYQVATSQVSPGDVSYSLRKVFAQTPNVDSKLAEVVSIDPLAKKVVARTSTVPSPIEPSPPALETAAAISGVKTETRASGA